MGGKHKQAQRVKNNARPSSSGRSAEFVASSSSSTAFSPFSNLKDIGFVSTLGKTEDFDPLIDTNFQIVFKKMNKKDSTTRLKALQEFSELVSNSESEAVKIVLSFWTRVYNILATDSDHRIREAVQNAHYQIVLKDKKIIAPYLKQLIGAWFTSQYDTYPPAATAASKAFSATFASNKVQDCIVFCQKEILAYINENLTAESLANSKITGEEAEAKLERMLICSLQGYYMYLNSLTGDQIQDNFETNQWIISNVKFVKLAGHKSNIVRASWFKVLTALYQKAAFLLDSEHSKVTPIVVSNLDESDPTVVPFIWESAILLIGSVKEWWKYLQNEKLFVTKLWKVLQKGGQGSAAVIYPNFLAILAKLPPNLDLPAFYNKFFENLKLGLKQRTVVSSKSEGAAVVTTLIECLKYVILTNQHNLELCQSLIQSNLLPTIEQSFREQRSFDKIILNQSSALIRYWSRNRDQINYVHYLNYFWTNIQVIFQNIFEDSPELDCNDIKSIAQKQIKFIVSLKSSDIVKSQSRVKFSCEQADEDDTDSTSTEIINEGDQLFNEELKVLVYIILKSFIKLINDRHIYGLIHEFVELIRLMENREFLNGLNSELNPNNGGTLLVLYKNLVEQWLKNPELNPESVINIVFLLYKYLDVDSQKQVLESLLENCDDTYLGNVIAKMLCEPYKNDVLIQNWLLDKKIGSYLIDRVEKSLGEGLEPSFNDLMYLVFTPTENGDLLVQTAVVNAIIEKLEETLRAPPDSSSVVETAALLASNLLTIITSNHSVLNHGQNLVLSLFTFTCNNHKHFDLISNDCLEQVRGSWQESLALIANLMPKLEFLTYVKQFSKIIQQKFFDNFDSDNMNNEYFVDILIAFLKPIARVQALLVADIFKDLFSNSLIPQWQNQITESCKYSQFLLAKLYSSEMLNKGASCLDQEDILKYFSWISIKLSLLASQIVDPLDDESDNGDEKVILAQLIDDSPQLIVGGLYVLSQIKIFITDYKMSRYHKRICAIYELMIKQIQFVINHLQMYNQIRNLLVEELKTESWLWAYAAYLLYTQVAPSELIGVYRKLMAMLPSDADLPKLHLTQVFGPSLNYDEVDAAKSMVESVIVLRNLLHCDEIDVQIAEGFGRIERLREKDVRTFLFENNKLGWTEFQEIIESVNFFADLIKYKFDCLTRRHWDFGVISLGCWTSNCYKSRAQYRNEQAFVVALTRFYCNLCEKLKEVKVENPKNDFVNEWEDLFATNIHNDLLQLWFYFAEQFEHTENLNLTDHPFLQEFGKVISHFDHKLIFTSDGTLPNWTKILKRSCALLANSCQILQLWGYQMILKLIPGLIAIDLEAINANAPHEKGLVLEQFREVLTHTDQIVADLLLGFKLGENSCQVQPFTDSYTYVFLYLILWSIMLELCEKSPSELRFQYADWIRRDNYLKHLLESLFRLLPTEVLHYNEGKARGYLDLFSVAPNMSFENLEPSTSELLEHLSCWVYQRCLSQLPALVRQWWSETDSRVSQIIEKITTFYVSPRLCSQELQDVAHHETKFKNMVVKVLPLVREVIAIYTVDEAQMELVITLPINYPLGGPSVQCNRQISGMSHKQWLMQLKKCLLYQNGRVWDGLLLWNNNLDKKFDGIEECYICFAVLHTGTYQLPKISCQTCKKKFHSACLYKWFSTSNKSSCPICRNLF